MLHATAGGVTACTHAMRHHPCMSARPAFCSLELGAHAVVAAWRIHLLLVSCACGPASPPPSSPLQPLPPPARCQGPQPASPSNMKRTWLGVMSHSASAVPRNSSRAPGLPSRGSHTMFMESAPAAAEHVSWVTPRAAVCCHHAATTRRHTHCQCGLLQPCRQCAVPSQLSPAAPPCDQASPGSFMTSTKMRLAMSEEKLGRQVTRRHRSTQASTNIFTLYGCFSRPCRGAPPAAAVAVRLQCEGHVALGVTSKPRVAGVNPNLTCTALAP